MNKDYRKIDIEEASERLHMDADFIGKLIKRFLDSDMLENAEKAFTEANTEEARLEIHSIKGTAANVGLAGLSELALDIETKIKEDGYLDFELLNLMKAIWNELKNKYANI